MTTAADSPHANGAARGGGSSPGLRVGDRLVWTMPDSARIYVRVVQFRGEYVYLRCHHGGKAWTRKHRLPLFPSMKLVAWTTADLLETIE